jgi:hypothetical protein
MLTGTNDDKSSSRNLLTAALVTGMLSRSSLKRSTAASVCKTSTLMPFLAKTSRVLGQTLSRSQIPLDSTTALAPCSINS